MNEHPLIKETAEHMTKSLDHTLQEFSAIHTGKASPTMVEGIMVEAYGSQMRLKEVAAITTPDARLIQVQPWDKSLVKPIEKAIQVANIGINPSTDGNVIRLPLPELSGERRKELVKVAHRLAEEGRVSVRHARHDGLEAVKKLQKNGEISEDDLKRYEKEIQKHTDRFIKEIGDHLNHKEQELLTV
jgi:ribosome recycling factor